jgi:hypothetical protein
LKEVLSVSIPVRGSMIHSMWRGQHNFDALHSFLSRCSVLSAAFLLKI